MAQWRGVARPERDVRDVWDDVESLDCAALRHEGCPPRCSPLTPRPHGGSLEADGLQRAAQGQLDERLLLSSAAVGGALWRLHMRLVGAGGADNCRLGCGGRLWRGWGEPPF